MKVRINAAGWMATLIIWVITPLVLLGVMMGDCAPMQGRVCPSSGDRPLQVLATLATAVLLNGALVWLISLKGRDDS